jgi:hypothetical protein
MSVIKPGINLEVFKQPINGSEKDCVLVFNVVSLSIDAPRFVNAS